MTDEQWRAVVDFPGYEVSSLGRVRSYWRPHHGITDVARLLKLTPADNGYLRVGLTRSGGQPTTVHVHKLVLVTFVGPAPQGMECRHRDGNQLNNSLANLTWGTKAENSADQKHHAKRRCRRSDRCVNGHRFDEANTYVRSDGRRGCRTCHRDRGRRARAAHASTV